MSEIDHAPFGTLTSETGIWHLDCDCGWTAEVPDGEQDAAMERHLDDEAFATMIGHTITFRYPAPTGTAFTDEAAQSMVGNRPHFDLLSHRYDAVVTDAQVIDGGVAINVTVTIEAE